MSNERRGLMTLIKVAPIVGLVYIFAIIVLWRMPSHAANVVAFFMLCAFILWSLALTVVMAVIYNKQKATLNEATKKVMRIMMIVAPCMVVAQCVIAYLVFYPW